METNSELRSTFLRPEARPFSWASLNDSQREAFESIVYSMANSIEMIDQRSKAGHTSSSVYLDYDRSNQTLLLTGDRGMGKTSLLLSLQRALVEPGVWKSEIPEAHQASFDRLKYPFENRLEGRIVWLETLDMEPLPGPTNLLVSILARIDHAIGKAQSTGGTQTPPGLLSPQPGSEAALMELRRLTTDASLAWDGNIDARAAHLDPDPFAAEVMRAERSRLSLNQKLGRLLDDLANITWHGRVRSPLFVLPVDDFDLNPVRCLDLLRLVRTINVPRLFTLVLGDLEVIEKTFRLKMAGDFAGVANIRLSADRLYQTDFFMDIRSTASEALIKLLPPGQRISLKILTINEALKYKPDQESNTLQDILDKWTLTLELPQNNRPKGGGGQC